MLPVLVGSRTLLARGRGVAWRALALGVLLSLLAGLSNAQAAADADPMDALQMLGRTRPEQAIERLSALLQGLPPEGLQRVRALEQLGGLQADMDDDKAEQTALLLDKIAEQAPPMRSRALAAASMVRAKALFHDDPLLNADRLAGEALATLPEATPAMQRLPYMLLAADVKERDGRLDDALRLQFQALDVADATAPEWERSEVRSALARTLQEVGQKDRARTLNREALELARHAGDELALAKALTTESMLLAGLNDPEEPAALQGAIEHARRAGAQRQEVLGLVNICGYHLKRAQYATAIQSCDLALPPARALRQRAAESQALVHKGLALIGLRHITEGITTVLLGLALDARMGSVPRVANAHAELGTALEKAGAPRQALEAYREHRRLADELFRQEQQKYVLELQEGFDNERRQRELQLLEQESRLKEEQLVQHGLKQRVWALGAACALLTLGVIGLLAQRARRANRLLASTNELLKIQSERDPLTGLANRRHLQHAMHLQGGDRAFEGTAYLIDIDHFKQINDVHGHAAGDTVLVEVARRLRAALRDADLVVRWGGEEFVIVVRSLSPQPVESLAQRLLSTVAGEPVTCDGKPVPVTASIGFATFPLAPAQVAMPWERAVELVDAAMYLAKTHGRNRAYGVRLLQGQDAADVARIAKALEPAWRAGEVTLALLEGPPGEPAP